MFNKSFSVLVSKKIKKYKKKTIKVKNEISFLNQFISITKKECSSLQTNLFKKKS